jgi:DNA (cytosine-5)-methyltransferase 1
MPEPIAERSSIWQQPIRVGNSVAGEGHGGNPTNGFWASADWLGCRDGLYRPVEPGTFPLAHGVACRMDKLRAYGNAINREAAIAFIGSAMEAELFL